MALIRSAFWLSVAFAVVGPQVGADRSVDGMARDMAANSAAAGRQFISAQLDRVECQTLECHSGKAVVGAGLGMMPSAPEGRNTMPSSHSDPGESIPVPAPRPAWMG